jgi:diaminopimelate decarboxylase
MEELPPWLNAERVRKIVNKVGTPVYVYSHKMLESQADEALAFPNAYGLTVRYAIKANPNEEILNIFLKKGIDIDASSGHEAIRAMQIGFLPHRILLTSQQIPDNLKELINRGVQYTACSLYQLDYYGQRFPNSDVSIRINPGLGSGGTNRTNTGGPASPFGIWHEQLPDVFRKLRENSMNVSRIHTHIGSGSDPEVWKKTAGMSLDIVEKFLENGYNIETLNLGGGYKVARMSYEKKTDLQLCGHPVKEMFQKFYEAKKRKLKLEIEPGTFLVANSGAIIARVEDVKSTSGYNFIITNTGMTEIARPSLYGAQHPIVIVPMKNEKRETLEQVVFGHCCESGDILTPAQGDSEALGPRELLRAKIGDIVVIGGAGAYCASMSTKGYNSYPKAREIMIS